MKRLPAILFAVLALSPIPALAAVSGVAISFEGVALPDVKITAYPQESSAARRERLMKGAERETLTSAVTDAKGLFTIDMKDAPVFDLEFRKPGHAPASIRVSQNESIGAVMLRAAADRSGVIRAGGNPLPEASVVFGIRNEGELIVRTDENGRYVVPDPDRWADTMTVFHPDFARTVVPRRPQSKWSMDVSPAKGVAISGRVVAADGKSPVAGARIFVDGWYAGESGENGSFSLVNLPSNWTEIRAVKEGQLASRTRATGSNSLLRMGRASALRGTVTEAGSRRPVAGASISLNRTGQQAAPEWVISDAKGNFSLPSMTPGTFRVAVSAPGYAQPVPSDVSVAAGETVSRPLIVSRGGSLEGVVLDENGKPVAAAGVIADRRPPGMPLPPPMFIRDGSRAFTAPDGRFVIRNLAPEEGYNVQANREGFAEGRETGIEITAGERRSGVRITLPSGYELAGRVADQRGRGIAGATIVATKALPEVRGMRRAFFYGAAIEDGPTTSANGSFSLRLAEGTYDIEIRREGFAPRQLPNVRVERNNDPLSVVLVEGVAIAGRVVTAGGSPVADAGMTLHSTELGLLGSTMTSVDGSFAFEDLAAGAATLSVMKPDDFIQFSQPVKAPDTNVMIELPAGGGVTGRVLDRSSKQPLTSFSAGLSNVRSGGGAMRVGPPMMKEFRSDDGSFVLENVPVGQHQIQVSAPGYVTARLSGVNVEEGKSVRDFEVLMEPGVRVTGKVTGPDGAGLESVFIQAQDPADRMAMAPMRPMTTDADGEYVIEGLAAGERTLRFNKQGYVPEQKAVNISGKEARVDVRLSRGLEVRGTVVDASGRPVAEASVMAQAPGAGARASSDTNGAFTIEGLTAGRYSITATKTGLASEVLRDVDIATTGHLRLVLDVGGTIYGRVSGHDETLASSIIVRASSREGNAQSSIDTSGNFRIEGAPLGTVTVVAASRGSNSGSKQVEVSSGQSYQVDLEFRSDIVISGRVTKGGGAAGLSYVTFLPSDARLQSRGSAPTDADGFYSVSGLEPGDYNVNVMDQSSLQP
ncbi:MAG TPA: carboxypeptidase-like regulatory domain-containing protein, partial [Thermoanaerobaculia bacterium]|nr:carboxypeptidase-like regulatory domain-containing protein [Thermoanaerobaculia bacterium]